MVRKASTQVDKREEEQCRQVALARQDHGLGPRRDMTCSADQTTSTSLDGSATGAPRIAMCEQMLDFGFLPENNV